MALFELYRFASSTNILFCDCLLFWYFSLASLTIIIFLDAVVVFDHHMVVAFLFYHLMMCSCWRNSTFLYLNFLVFVFDWIYSLLILQNVTISTRIYRNLFLINRFFGNYNIDYIILIILITIKFLHFPFQVFFY